MIHHIVTGDFAAAPLKDAISASPEMQGQVIVLKDVLSVGPIQRGEGQKFSAMRSAFWQEVVPNEKSPIEVDDLERLLTAGNELSKNEDAKIWIWMAPLPADICTYYWVLSYLGKYIGRIFVVNIAGLPFLDDSGKLFYPRSIAEIMPRELVKARKLARPITPSELETDAEEWARLIRENGGNRIHEGGKKLTSKKENYYDAVLTGCCTEQYQKASRVINQAMAKSNIPTGDLYLGWRLRKMAEAGLLQLQGDTSKSIRDYDVKLSSGKMEF